MQSKRVTIVRNLSTLAWECNYQPQIPRVTHALLDCIVSVVSVIRAMRLLIFLLVVLLAGMSQGAPAPFPKAGRPQPVALSLRGLAGQWVLYWGSTPYEVTIGHNGVWRAVASPNGTTWTGTVEIQRGKLWLVENANPANASGWSSYCLDLDPRTLQGKVIEGCEEPTTVALCRPGAEPLTMPRAEE